MPALLSEIVQALGGHLVGSPGTLIESLSPLSDAGPHEISFLSHSKYLKDLSSSHAACVIVSSALEQAAQSRGAYIVTENPYLYFARLTQWWKQKHQAATPPGIHASAVIDPSAEVAADASIGPFVVVEAGAQIGSGVVIGAHSVVGSQCVLGANTRLAAHVTLYANVRIGKRCLIHSGAVIGADGFGFAPTTEKTWEKIEQLGAVVIGNEVEIGANTTIDRGALGDTELEDGVKLDNLIQIAHNVRVGAHTAMAACVGVAGSATIGKHCTLGGGAIVLGHLSVADHVHISAASIVTRSIAKAGNYTGFFPIDENANWEKNAAVVKQLAEWRRHWRRLST